MPTIDVTEEEAQVLLKLLQMGKQKVASQHYVNLKNGGRLDTSLFLTGAERVIANIAAQVALSK